MNRCELFRRDNIDRDLHRRNRPAVLQPVESQPVLGPTDSRSIVRRNPVAVVGDCPLQNVDDSWSVLVIVNRAEDTNPVRWSPCAFEVGARPCRRSPGRARPSRGIPPSRHWSRDPLVRHSSCSPSRTSWAFVTVVCVRRRPNVQRWACGNADAVRCSGAGRDRAGHPSQMAPLPCGTADLSMGVVRAGKPVPEWSWVGQRRMTRMFGDARRPRPGRARAGRPCPVRCR